MGVDMLWGRERLAAFISWEKRVEGVISPKTKPLMG